MKKQVLNIFVIFLLNESYTYAQKADLSPSIRSIQFRVGGGLEGALASTDIDVKNSPYVAPSDPATIPIIAHEEGDFFSNGHHSNRKLNIAPHLELGAFLNHLYYLGFSISLNFIKAHSSMKIPTGLNYNLSHSFNLNNYINFSLKFGYKLSPNVMFFGLVGPTFANWSHQTKSFYYESTPHSIKVKNNAESCIKTTGLGVGAGIEYWVSKNATISFQYALHLYPPKTIKYNYTYAQMVETDVDGVPITFPEVRNGNAQKKVRLTHSSIGLRFSYFFSFK